MRIWKELGARQSLEGAETGGPQPSKPTGDEIWIIWAAEETRRRKSEGIRASSVTYLDLLLGDIAGLEKCQKGDSSRKVGRDTTYQVADNDLAFAS